MKVATMVFTILLAFNALTLDPPIWPEHFSQSFQVQTGLSVQTGKIWYDFGNQKFRVDYYYPDKRLCQVYYQYKSPCTILWVNNIVYNFLPQEKLCNCFHTSDPITRDWLRKSNYIFTGQVQLEGKSFYRWQRYNRAHIEYLADKSQKMVPRRNTEDKIIWDYWVDSYNDGPINQNVFNIPNFCNQGCNNSVEEVSQKKQKIFQE